MLRVLEERLDAVLDGADRAGTTVLLVGRGSTDPDANAEICKVARLLWEGRGLRLVEPAFVSLAEPGVAAGLERCRLLLGAAGDGPAVAVHAWSGPGGSGRRAAGRLALGRVGGAGGRGPGGGGDPAEPVGIGPGRGGGVGCRPGHPPHGALDLGHVRDRVAR
jgi:hypothetical protein